MENRKRKIYICSRNFKKRKQQEQLSFKRMFQNWEKKKFSQNRQDNLNRVNKKLSISMPITVKLSVSKTNLKKLKPVIKKKDLTAGFSSATGSFPSFLQLIKQQHNFLRCLCPKPLSHASVLYLQHTHISVIRISLLICNF